MRIYNQLKLKPLQRKLRKNSTDVERLVWNLVRNRQIEGLKFFRQYGAGTYILDFYCPQLKLAIEIDGGQHDENSEKDSERTQYLNSLGIEVLRFWNNDVLQNIEGVYENTISKIKQLTLTLSLKKRGNLSPSFIKEGTGGSS